jgi:hypothetical protein
MKSELMEYPIVGGKEELSQEVGATVMVAPTNYLKAGN